jgi:hypothetical protein
MAGSPTIGSDARFAESDMAQPTPQEGQMHSVKMSKVSLQEAVLVRAKNKSGRKPNLYPAWRKNS